MTFTSEERAVMVLALKTLAATTIVPDLANKAKLLAKRLEGK